MGVKNYLKCEMIYVFSLSETRLGIKKKGKENAESQEFPLLLDAADFLKQERSELLNKIY